MKVYRICEHCNKEFILNFEPSPVGIGGVNTTQECPHCKEENNIWIRIVSEGDSQDNAEAVEQPLTGNKSKPQADITPNCKTCSTLTSCCIFDKVDYCSNYTPA